MQQKSARSALFACAAAVLATALHLGATAVARAVEPYRAPRTADGKADLNGVWQALNTANWDLPNCVDVTAAAPTVAVISHTIPADTEVVATGRAKVMRPRSTRCAAFS
jgi:hypothetical protein